MGDGRVDEESDVVEACECAATASGGRRALGPRLPVLTAATLIVAVKALLLVLPLLAACLFAALISIAISIATLLTAVRLPARVLRSTLVLLILVAVLLTAILVLLILVRHVCHSVFGQSATRRCSSGHKAGLLRGNAATGATPMPGQQTGRP
jgi:hypothetical protein